MFKAIFQYRQYILSNAIGDLRYRYAGSAIGMFWHILTPLLQIIVYTYVFSEIMSTKLPTLDNVGSFSLYLCSGMFCWFAFSECLTRGANTFIESSAFLKKLSVPEIVFVAQKVLATLFNCLLTYIIIFIYSIFILKTVYIYWILVPFIIILVVLFGFGLATILASLNVFFRDTAQFVNILTLVWMWLTPIVYVEQILPENFKTLIYLNPIYPYIRSLHDIILFGIAPQFYVWAGMIIYSTVSVTIGFFVLRKLSGDIRDLL